MSSGRAPVGELMRLWTGRDYLRHIAAVANRSLLRPLHPGGDSCRKAVEAAGALIDEVVGQWIAIWPVSFGMWQLGQASWTIPWQFLVVCFALFRLFDIWKPGPVGWADRRHNAMGVMLDDVVAGLLAAAVFFFGMLWQSWIFDFIEALQWLF